METMVRTFKDKTLYNTGFPVLQKRDDFDVEITGFIYSYFKNRYKLNIYSKLIFKDNYSLSLIDNKLFVVISEIKQLNKPSYLHNYNWKNSDINSYERIRSMDILLPGDDFYLIRHFVVPDKNTLSIILSTYK